VLPSLVAGAIAGYGIAIPVGPVAILIIELGVRLRESADLHERLTVLEQNAVLQDQPVLPTSVA